MPTHQNTLSWRKSQRSGTNGQCVELAPTPTAIAIRDSHHPKGPILNFHPAEWQNFLVDTKQGHHDLP